MGTRKIGPAVAAPFGEVMDSGMGREGGAEGIAEYLPVMHAQIAL